MERFVIGSKVERGPAEVWDKYLDCDLTTAIIEAESYLRMLVRNAESMPLSKFDRKPKDIKVTIRLAEEQGDGGVTAGRKIMEFDQAFAEKYI